MVELNSNPEILLKKRKNADRLRLEKQEQVAKRREEQKRKKSQRKEKFIRAETLVAQSLATKREHERIKRISKLEKKQSAISNNKNNTSFIEKISKSGTKQKEVYLGKPTLYFIVRIRGPYGVKIPSKPAKVLSLLRLNHINTGVFIRLTETTYPLLKLITPYTVIGKPSLQSVRQLIQKRATVNIKDKETGDLRTVKLNDNAIIEDKLGDDGIICMEDIIHEIASLGENFKKVTYFLNPFKLSIDIAGFGPLAKLKKLEKREDQKNQKYSNAGAAPILEIDIDDFIAEQN